MDRGRRVISDLQMLRFWSRPSTHSDFKFHPIDFKITFESVITLPIDLTSYMHILLTYMGLYIEGAHI